MTEQGTFTKLKGTSSLVGGAFVIGTFGIFSRFVTPMFNYTAQTALRFGLATLIVVAIIAFTKKKVFTIPKKDVPVLLLLGVGAFGLGMLFTVAVNTTKVADGLSLLFGASIITTLIIGTLAFKEKITVSKIIAITIALAGLAIYANSFAVLGIGMAAAIGAGIVDGICNSLRKRLKTADRNAVVMYQYLIAAACTLPLFLVPSDQPAITGFSLTAIIALLLYAVASVGLGNLLMYGFARFDVNVGSVVLATQIFFAMLLGMLFLGEYPAGHEIGGALLILLATTFTALDIGRLRKNIRSSKPQPGEIM